MQLIGNLGNDPEVRIMQNGGRVVTLSIATSESWKDRSSGERKQRTEWHRVVIFSEGLGEIVEKYLAKGAKVFIEGALRTRKWQDQSGADRYSTEIHLTQYNGTLTFLDARKDDARSSEQHATREQASGNDGMTPKFDDEIPFAPCWQ